MNSSFDVNPLDDIYQEVILDHYQRPRNKGVLTNPDISSRGFNPFCGDEIILSIKLDSNGKAETILFDGQGCSISQASASMLTELLSNKNLDELKNVSYLFRSMMRGENLSSDEMALIEGLEVLEGVKQFPIRIKCALLAWAALEDGIEEFSNKTLNRNS
jgi:nitrogen fixation NifU-like protein